MKKCNTKHGGISRLKICTAGQDFTKSLDELEGIELDLKTGNALTETRPPRYTATIQIASNETNNKL